MLQTRSVFLDTEVYIRHGLRFDHPNLARLRDLCAAHRLRLLITETVCGEIEREIGERVSDGLAGLARFQKSAAFLSLPENSSTSALFAKPSAEELQAIAMSNWNRFLEGANAVRVPSTSVSGTLLLSLYFQQSPPFGPSSKKSEFPDAISAASLANWSKDFATPVYVISGDSDMARWCDTTETAFHIEQLPSFLDLFNRTEEALTQTARDLYEKNVDIFREAIASAFESCGFHYEGDWEANVEDVSVNQVELQEVDVIVVEEGRALISVDADISYEAKVMASDYEHAVWDSEEKQYFHLPQHLVATEVAETFTASIEFRFDPEKLHFEHIYTVVIGDGSDIEIPSEDDYPYK
jgi:hypothetical protein